MLIRDLRNTKQTVQTPPSASQVITVLGPKGGVGKSIVAGSIAVTSSVSALRRTLLLDTDLDSGDIGVHFDLPEGRSISDLAPYCTDPRPDVLAQFVTKHDRSGVDVIMAPPRPELAEFVRSEHVGSLLDCARKTYQCVVVDTPPSLGCDIVYECLEHSDLQVLVVTQDLACIRQAKTSLELLRRLGHNVAERCHVLINRYYERGLLTRGKIVEFLGVKHIHTVVDERETIDRAILDGVPVIIQSRTENVSQQLSEFSRMILGLPREHQPKKRRGVWRFGRGDGK